MTGNSNGSGFHTHIPVVVGVALRTGGDVLEMGCGYYSTPILHDLCRHTGRRLFTCETDRGWASHLSILARASHHTFWLGNHYDRAPISQPWGLAVLDHCPREQRLRDLDVLRHWAEIIVVHAAGEEGFRDMLASFRFARLVTHVRPWCTAIASHRREVESLDIYEPP